MEDSRPTHEPTTFVQIGGDTKRSRLSASISHIGSISAKKSAERKPNFKDTVARKKPEAAKEDTASASLVGRSH